MVRPSTKEEKQDFHGQVRYQIPIIFHVIWMQATHFSSNLE